MRFVERNTTQRNFMMQTAMKMQDFLEIIKSFSLKTIFENRVIQRLGPTFSKTFMNKMHDWIWVFYINFFFACLTRWEWLLRKKPFKTLPPPPSIYVYLFVKWSSFQKVTIYIFLTKKNTLAEMLVYYKCVFQIDKFRYKNSIYFEAAYKF